GAPKFTIETPLAYAMHRETTRNDDRIFISSENDKRSATRGGVGMFSLYNLRTGDKIFAGPGNILSGSFSSDGKLLVTVAEGQDLPGGRAIQLRKGQTGERFKDTHGNPVLLGLGGNYTKASFAKDGRSVVAMGQREIAVFDVHTLTKKVSIQPG